jgi:hypothetical protein
MNRLEKRLNNKHAQKAAKKAASEQVSIPIPLEQGQTLAIQQAIDLAIQHHTAGDLPQSESIINKYCKPTRTNQ